MERLICSHLPKMDQWFKSRSSKENMVVSVETRTAQLRIRAATDRGVRGSRTPGKFGDAGCARSGGAARGFRTQRSRRV